LSIAFIARPVIENRGFAVTDSDRRTSALQAQRDQILTVLQELDMDHAIGKIEEGGYFEQRSVLVARGAAVLKELDQLVGVVVETDGQEKSQDLGSRKDDASRELEAQIENAVSNLRERGSDSEDNFCSHCGKVLVSGDRFCAHCGTAIQVGET
jgi:hypothetical protein